ncbi:hypothetical protein [Photobacterium aquimaris]|jgi:hypothetical protein|uniref:hypothetical protein n=1 Tax=Photobacterium aquimaris TaxID=512643 RepID=UPI000A9D74C8|nr:hypothetical protein [Photobacterium aquimaris]
MVNHLQELTEVQTILSELEDSPFARDFEQDINDLSFEVDRLERLVNEKGV